MRTSLQKGINWVRRQPVRGVVTVLAGFLLMVSFGGLFTFGNLTTYMTSYLHVALGQDLGYGQTIWVGNTLGVTEGMLMIPGCELYRKYGPRVVIVTGCLLSSGAIALTSLTVKTSIWWLTLTYGALNGCGVGFVYGVPLLVGYRWFPHNKGLVSGLVVGGYGLGGILFATLQTEFLNPNNVSPGDDGFFHDEALLGRVPQLFLLMAAVCAGLQFLTVFGIQDPSQSDRATEDAAYEDSQGRGSKAETDERSESSGTKVNGLCHEAGPHPASYQNRGSTGCSSVVVADDQPVCVKGPESGQRCNTSTGPTSYTMREALQTRHFYHVAFTFMAMSLCIAIINPLWKAFGQTFISNDHYLEMVSAGTSVFNLLGRLCWGALGDKLGYKPTMILLSGCFSIIMLTLHTTSIGGAVMFTLWLWGLFFCFSGIYSTVCSGIANAYGLDHAGSIYGLVFFLGGVLGPLVPLMTEFLLDDYGYSLMFLIGGIGGMLSLAATLTVQPLPTESSVV